MSNDNNRVGTAYGEEYLSWKDWHSRQFGNLTNAERRYFTSELRRTGIIVSQDVSVLEIGFGNGSFLTYAKERKWSIVGVEINKGLVETAQRHGFSALHTENVSLIEDKSYDLVVAFDVLEHIDQEELFTVLKEIKRILRYGGVFIARFPNGDSPFGLLYQNGDTTHKTTIGSSKAHYWANKLGVELLFVGGAAEPLNTGSRIHTLHRLLALPIRKIINAFVNIVFFAPRRIAFCSSNLVMVVRMIKPTAPPP